MASSCVFITLADRKSLVVLEVMTSPQTNPKTQSVAAQRNIFIQGVVYLVPCLYLFLLVLLAQLGSQLQSPQRERVYVPWRARLEAGHRLPPKVPAGAYPTKEGLHPLVWVLSPHWLVRPILRCRLHSNRTMLPIGLPTSRPLTWPPPELHSGVPVW